MLVLDRDNKVVEEDIRRGMAQLTCDVGANCVGSASHNFLTLCFYQHFRFL